VLVTHEISLEAVKRLEERFVVDSNQQDLPLSPTQSLQKVKGKDGVVTLSTDIVSDQSHVASHCRMLREGL
jgi:hypothetical protein